VLELFSRFAAATPPVGRRTGDPNPKILESRWLFEPAKSA
jgi:hypothetical protein